MPKKRIPFLIADIAMMALSVYLAFLLRFELTVPGRYNMNIYGIILLSTAITIPIFYFFKLYSFSWIYVSTQELLSLIKATTLSFLIVTASFFVLRDYDVFSGFPRSTLFITYFFIFIFCGGIRFAKRIYLQLFNNKNFGKKEKTLIVGAGGAGEQVLRNILGSKNSPYSPVGFIDDNLDKRGLLIHGFNVLGGINDIPKIAKEKNIDSLIIAFPSAGSELIKKAEKKGIEAGILDIKYLPPMDEIINSADEIGVGELRDIDTEDLLGRETKELDEAPIKESICAKRILITGAAGSIGSELSRQVAKFEPQALFLLDQDETGIFNISQELKDIFPGLKYFPIVADICNKEHMEWLMRRISPEVIFHAAAYKHVPLMEEEPQEAARNNILGTDILTGVFQKICDGDGVVKKFVFISTDKAVNPTSVMGATKRFGEMICQMRNQGSKNIKFISVRFGNVLGSRGSVIPVFKEQISRGGPVKITHKDMSRYFMLTSEACLLVMQAGAMGLGGEVFVLDMGSAVKIIDLAKKLIKLADPDDTMKIEIEYLKPRPGEKLFEEILTAEEGTSATKNEKIFMTKAPSVNVADIDSAVIGIKRAVDNFDRNDLINILKKTVPFYNPSNYVLNNN